jgi:hypothetical protein
MVMGAMRGGPEIEQLAPSSPSFSWCIPPGASPGQLHVRAEVCKTRRWSNSLFVECKEVKYVYVSIYPKGFTRLG